MEPLSFPGRRLPATISDPDRANPGGATPWSRAANKFLDQGVAGPVGPPQLNAGHALADSILDPAYKGTKVLADPSGAASASQQRWGGIFHGDFGKLGSDYWNDPGTAFTQDMASLHNSSNPLVQAGVHLLDSAAPGVSSPYINAAAGDMIGGASHAVYGVGRELLPIVAGEQGSRVLFNRGATDNLRNDWNTRPGDAAANYIGVAGLLAGRPLASGEAAAAGAAGRGAVETGGAEVAPGISRAPDTAPGAPTADAPTPAGPPGRVLPRNTEPGGPSGTNPSVASKGGAGRAPSVPSARTGTRPSGPAGTAPGGRTGGRPLGGSDNPAPVGMDNTPLSGGKANTLPGDPARADSGAGAENTPLGPSRVGRLGDRSTGDADEPAHGRVGNPLTEPRESLPPSAASRTGDPGGVTGGRDSNPSNPQPGGLRSAHEPDSPTGNNPSHASGSDNAANEPGSISGAPGELPGSAKASTGQPEAAPMSIPERLTEVYQRLDRQPRATTAQEAIDQLSATLDQVEDRYSGVPRNPNPGLKPDGRMYPPRADFITEGPDGELIAQTRGNMIYASRDGSLRITSRRDGSTVYQREGAGSDGIPRDQTSPSPQSPPDQIRQAYNDEISGLAQQEGQLRAAGRTDEEIARTLSQARRDIGEKYKDLTPESERSRIYARNLEKYGDKLGPTVDRLRAQGKTWREIIESAKRTSGKDLGYKGNQGN